ncbi:hypothetical protein [Chlorogloeopsis sp. ULAP01]|nr:hypothetical protein [Chlorogloeopsis sp. ULAP01]
MAAVVKDKAKNLKMKFDSCDRQPASKISKLSPILLVPRLQ